MLLDLEMLCQFLIPEHVTVGLRMWKKYQPFEYGDVLQYNDQTLYLQCAE